MVKVDPKCLAARRKDGCAIDQKKLRRQKEQQRAGAAWRKQHVLCGFFLV